MIKTLQNSNINVGEITIFEPACGNGAIVKELESVHAKVISRDLYTTNEKQDYLLCEDPQYDNPPFALKYEFAKKSIFIEKAFCDVAPVMLISTKRWISNFGKNKGLIQLLSSCDFLQSDINVSVAAVFGFMGILTF